MRTGANGGDVDDPGGAWQAFLSTQPAGRVNRRLALAVVLTSLAAFLAAAPFAQVRLAPIPAFLPIYQSALVVNELVTAVLLFGQFAILQVPALLVLACAYLFSALMAASHALSFPGLFSATGLFGAGPQTTAWLYFLWHGGFPLLVIAYALMGFQARGVRGGPRAAIALGVLATVLAALALTLFATVGHDALPVIMSGNRDAPAKLFVAAGSWLLCLAALPLLWRRRPHSVLDLWLMVVMCVWTFDIALAAVLNAGRFDVGWYVGRAYGLLAASFVLLVLLLENGALHARLAEAHARHGKRLQILHEIDKAVAAERPPEAIAGAAIQPLREVLGVPRAIVNLFDLAAGEVQWLAAAGRRRTHVGPGVRFPLQYMGDLEALKRNEPQLVATQTLPAGPERDALLASGVHFSMLVPLIAGGELIGALSFGGAQAKFPAEQLTIAREAATQLAIAIAQARLCQRVRRQAEELDARVRERTAELQSANKELESFSYSVSHDLRSPLRAIDGYARILAEDHAARLDDEGLRVLGVVREEAAHMGRLIDDLLAFSRLGRQALASAPLDMQAVVREVVQEVASQYPGVQVELHELPRARGDRALLKQVWMNLVGNAFKYSSKSAAPRVAISGTARDAETEYVVSDNGAGFDMRYADKLFAVFQRLHRAEEFPGTGVGLAIVQRIVARHGGRVWAEGKPNEGARFGFALPNGG
jgi:signal transduction histidine kinase